MLDSASFSFRNPQGAIWAGWLDWTGWAVQLLMFGATPPCAHILLCYPIDLFETLENVTTTRHMTGAAWLCLQTRTSNRALSSMKPDRPFMRRFLTNSCGGESVVRLVCLVCPGGVIPEPASTSWACMHHRGGGEASGTQGGDRSVVYGNACSLDRAEHCILGCTSTAACITPDAGSTFIVRRPDRRPLGFGHLSQQDNRTIGCSLRLGLRVRAKLDPNMADIDVRLGVG